GADQPFVNGKAEQLRHAGRIARDGAGTIGGAQRRVIYAVDDAQNAGFQVQEDLSVVDTRTSPNVGVQVARQTQAQALAADIGQRAAQLVLAEHEVAGKITAATAGVATPTFPGTHPSGPQAPTPPGQQAPTPSKPPTPPTLPHTPAGGGTVPRPSGKPPASSVPAGRGGAAGAEPAASGAGIGSALTGFSNNPGAGV